MRASALLAVLVLLPAGAVRAQPDAEYTRTRTSAGIRIELPSGSDAAVSVSPGTERVVVELPAAADYPDDFAEASGGLLRDGRAEVRGDRVRLELELGAGLLERVDYEPGAVVLHFQSRNRSLGSGEAGEQYRLGGGDKVRISVHGHDDLTKNLVITREGWLTTPLLGDVKAAGLTPRELASRLADLLGRDYIVDPQVDVEVETYRSQWVMVTGEVERRGRLPLMGGTRLKEVLSEAEGFTEYAGETITVSRQVEGSDRTVTLELDRDEFETGMTNPTLQHGDIVDVPRADYCYIQGEVRDPNRVRIERGMTLMRVIALAGGFTDWADRKTITVLYGVGVEPRERVFNLKKIERGKSEDPPMVGGEIIIVKKRFL